jgi:hypothetical protein
MTRTPKEWKDAGLQMDSGGFVLVHLPEGAIYCMSPFAVAHRLTKFDEVERERDAALEKLRRLTK